MNDLYTFEPLDNERGSRMSDPNADENKEGGCSGSCIRLPELFAGVFVVLWWAAMIAEAFTG